MNGRFRPLVIGYVLLALAYIGTTACSAILGIEDIPPAGDFPVDAAGTCAELGKEGLHSVCPAAAFQMCSVPVFVCNDTTRTCVCPTEDGSLGDVMPFDGFVNTDGGVCPTPPCNVMDGPPPPEHAMQDVPTTMDTVVPPMDSMSDAPPPQDVSGDVGDAFGGG
jgi:hypothetical protein